jgi:hypothetical protein
LICTPGTTFVIGGRFAALGAMTPRSVTGVNANAGRPGIEFVRRCCLRAIRREIRAREAVHVGQLFADLLENVLTSVGAAPGGAAPADIETSSDKVAALEMRNSM